MNRFYRYLVIAITVILLAFGVSSCGASEENEGAREICTTLIDSIIENDMSAIARLYGVEESEMQKDVFDKYRELLKDTKTYELKQTGWNYSKSTSGSVTTSYFQATTDDQKIIGVTVEEYSDGSIGLYIGDDTEFNNSTQYVFVASVFFTLLAIAFTAFTVWMIVDACKRKLKKKALWIILILLSAWIQISFGLEYFNLNFGVGILVNVCQIAKNFTYRYVVAKLSFPIGAIIYFFKRENLPLKEIPTAEEANTEESDTQESNDADESASEETQENE